MEQHLLFFDEKSFTALTLDSDRLITDGLMFYHLTSLRKVNIWFQHLIRLQKQTVLIRRAEHIPIWIKQLLYRYELWFDRSRLLGQSALSTQPPIRFQFEYSYLSIDSSLVAANQAVLLANTFLKCSASEEQITEIIQNVIMYHISFENWMVILLECLERISGDDGLSDAFYRRYAMLCYRSLQMSLTRNRMFFHLMSFSADLLLLLDGGRTRHG